MLSREEKEMARIEKYGELLSRIQERPFDVISSIKTTFAIDANDLHYFYFLKNVIQHYRNVCEQLQAVDYYDFLNQHATDLSVMAEKLAELVHDEVEGKALTEEDQTGIDDDVTTIQKTIIKASVALLTVPSTEPYSLQCLYNTLNCIKNICFDYDGVFNKTLSIEFDALYQCFDSLTQYIMENVKPSWVENYANKVIANKMQKQLPWLCNAMKVNGIHGIAFYNTSEKCGLTIDRLRDLAIPSVSCTSFRTFSSAAATGIPKDKHLSTVRAVFSDFDETLYLSIIKTIPACVAKQLNILRTILNIPIYVITARNEEMEHNDFYFKKDNTPAVFYKKNKSVHSVITMHHLGEVIPKENIIYCNFYEKIPAKNEAYTHYFCQTPTSKRTKIDDFLIAAKNAGLNPAHIAVYDDSDLFWKAISQYTRNFFHIENSQKHKGMSVYLNKLIVQLVLHGEHIPLEARVSAAEEALKPIALFQQNEYEFSELKKFIEEHQPHQEMTLQRP